MTANRSAWEDLDLPALDRLIDDMRRQVQRPPPEDPRGLLPTPPIVEALVIREGRKYPLMTPEERRRITDDLNLQYWFEDRDVLFRRTPQGIEVLAAGLDEIFQALGRLPPEERGAWTYGQG
jgi:hypothetical protein